MMNSKQVLHLYHYHVWADHRVFDQVKKLPREVFTLQVKSAFSTLQLALVHICYIDTIWLGVLEGRPYQTIMEEADASMEEMKEWSLTELEIAFADMAGKYTAFLTEEEDLERIIHTVHPGVGPMNMPISELVRHVVNHSTYHRGIICSMLHQLGYSGVNTDYIFFG